MGQTVKEYQRIFADRLTLLMDAHGLDGVMMSSRSGIPAPTIYRYRNLTREPKMEGAIQIADFFQVSLDWLVGRAASQDGRLSDEAMDFACLYDAISQDDRDIINSVLKKYRRSSE